MELYDKNYVFKYWVCTPIPLKKVVEDEELLLELKEIRYLRNKNKGLNNLDTLLEALIKQRKDLEDPSLIPTICAIDGVRRMTFEEIEYHKNDLDERIKNMIEEENEILQFRKIIERKKKSFWWRFFDAIGI